MSSIPSTAAPLLQSKDTDLASSPALPSIAIDRCSDDILAQIFLDAVISEFSNIEMYPIRRDETRFPYPCSLWDVAAVCARWRRICLNYPVLWSYVVFRWHTCVLEIFSPPGKAVTRLLLQLERSRNTLLHVDLDFNGCSCPCGISIFREMAKECHRWKSISRYGGCTMETYGLLPSLFPPSPVLSQLHSIRLQNIPFPFTKALTNLRCATMYRFYLAPGFPWKQLTHLRVFLDCMDQFSDILSIIQSANLVHLQLNPFFVMREQPDGDLADVFEKNSIVSETLVSLEIIHFSGEFGLDLFLPFIRLPNLQTLTCNQLDTPSVTLLADFFKRSSSPSSSLATLTTLDACIGEDCDDLTLIELLPQLESLTLRRYRAIHVSNFDYSCDKVLHELLRAEEDGARVDLCPRLQVLKLVSLPFDPALIVQLIKLRCDGKDPVPSLKRLWFGYFEMWQKESMTVKKMLEDELEKGLEDEGEKKPVRGPSIDWFLEPDIL